MKCNQCGKAVEQPCKRSDCGINEQTIKAEARRIRRNEQQNERYHSAQSEFNANYAVVAAWSEAQGYQRPSDRDTLAQWAASTPHGKLVIQAIARSL